VRGLRYPVDSLLELLASAMTIAEISEDHSDLSRVDLLTAPDFGALPSQHTHSVGVLNADSTPTTPRIDAMDRRSGGSAGT
jgi:hypothetical protein